MDAVTVILAKEPRGRDIAVNAIAPGPTATPLCLDGKDDETVERLPSMSPLEWLGTPEDAARDGRVSGRTPSGPAAQRADVEGAHGRPFYASEVLLPVGSAVISVACVDAARCDGTLIILRTGRSWSKRC